MLNVLRSIHKPLGSKTDGLELFLDEPKGREIFVTYLLLERVNVLKMKCFFFCSKIQKQGDPQKVYLLNTV